MASRGPKGKLQQWLEPDNLLLIQAWARDGFTDHAISEKMGINPSTLWTWKKKVPQISNALARTKEIVDIEVENKLYESCIGFKAKVKEPIKLKKIMQKAGEGRIEEEHIEYAEREIYIAPNVIAQKFWLANRKPNEWREKREIVADVSENAAKNMQTIADLINSPKPDRSIEELEAITEFDADAPKGDAE